MVQAESLAANKEAQRQLYGAPLGELLGGLAGDLALTQAKLASMLGISPPMLSQLMNARRIKIGNPVAAYRLQWLCELAPQVRAGILTADELEAQVRGASGPEALTRAASGHQFTTTVAGVGREPAGRERAVLLQEAFRDTASAGDFMAAAELLDAAHPRIAELLRVVGAGRTADAAALLERHRALS